MWQQKAWGVEGKGAGNTNRVEGQTEPEIPGSKFIGLRLFGEFVPGILSGAGDVLLFTLGNHPGRV